MDHRDAEPLLVDAAQGVLDPGQAAAFEAHVEACDDCRTWLETYRRLADAAAEDPAGHPSSDLLARFAAVAAGISAAERAGVESHLVSCAACREDVRLARTALEEARRPRRALPAMALPLALAATLVAATAAGLLYGQLRALRTELGQVAWSGPVVPLLLEDTPRGPDAATLSIRTSQPFALIVVRVDAPAAVGASEPARFELRDGAGQLLWSATIPVDEVRRATREEGGVFLQVPVAGLAAGSYRFVTRVGAPDATTLLDRVVRLNRVP
ncbi:MAG: hypothetical protein A3H96_22280 [Acidobacteria bacterium RIFCSPLOWO2_02_FULL_67_36]|nr:MAG: hypothetical protein A3H96_22280 [Acidobacteria bacterium RIFCSPLOWO2_02_FULL_67_36]